METPYIRNASREACKSHDIDEIRRKIALRGFWEAYDEWRISTFTEKRIEAVQRDGATWFRVRVACDHEFVTQCPTLERAVQFLSIYDRLIMDMFYTLDWPSWAEGGNSTHDA